ncbi:TM140 protein, partial [Crypturellus undulatus]|nr:TM140 protein [Crypturellus undulatus]
PQAALKQGGGSMGKGRGAEQQRPADRWLGTAMLLKSVLSFILMFYALFWEAGNFVDRPDKRLGFYNFCLWNEAARKLQCLAYTDLEGTAIN